MSDDFFLGLLLGLAAGAGWAFLFGIRKELHQQEKRAGDESLRRHLRDLEMDIEGGRLPHE